MNKRFILVVNLMFILGAPVHADSELSNNHARGMTTLDIITGGDTQRRLDALTDIAPELGEWITDFAYGDVVSRPGLDLRSRELATVARSDHADGGLCGLSRESERDQCGAGGVQRTRNQGRRCTEVITALCKGMM
jgi:hypothetical protein